ncbi:hypothetical protein JXB41_07260 [Candidatus Woesearchaeota archaeon]|nr:hypothetical protein [Candidatus Woesearchaeota archaeon]
MEDISNRTLATLLIAAIVISLGGTIISLNRLARISGAGALPLVGRATDGGMVNVTIMSSLSIYLSDDAIDFGTGWVNTSQGTCFNDGVNLTTLGTNDGNCWVNATGLLTPYYGDTWTVVNDGTLDVNITIYGVNNETFFGTAGTTPENQTYKWQLNDTQSNCDTAGDTGWNAFDANATLCADLPWGTRNSLDVDVWIRFPSNLTPQVYGDDVVFNAEQAS